MYIPPKLFKIYDPEFDKAVIEYLRSSKNSAPPESSKKSIKKILELLKLKK